MLASGVLYVEEDIMDGLNKCLLTVAPLATLQKRKFESIKIEK
jgi:hypothetical protein